MLQSANVYDTYHHGTSTKLHVKKNAECFSAIFWKTFFVKWLNVSKTYNYDISQRCPNG